MLTWWLPGYMYISGSCTHLLNSQGHNLYKLQFISLEEVKIVSFQQ